jgi:hypothetical protein
VYFDYKNHEGQTKEEVARIILKQLLLRSEFLPRELESAYDEWLSCSKVPDKALWINLIFSVSASCGSVYVVLDALDECSPECLEEVTTLVRLSKESRIKVLCTSRPHLMNLNVQLDTPTIAPIIARDEDVTNYLCIRLKKEWRYAPRFREQIINRLTRGAEGKSVTHPNVFELSR